MGQTTLTTIIMEIYLILSPEIFIYIGHLPIMGEYLDRFYKNIHSSYCLIRGIPDFIFCELWMTASRNVSVRFL